LRNLTTGPEIRQDFGPAFSELNIITVPRGLAVSERNDALEDEKQPGRCVQQEIKPVYGADKTALHKHLEFLEKVRGIERGKAERQTENNDQRP
jgi:hypothetical protein